MLNHIEECCKAADAIAAPPRTPLKVPEELNHIDTSCYYQDAAGLSAVGYCRAVTAGRCFVRIDAFPPPQSKPGAWQVRTSNGRTARLRLELTGSHLFLERCEGLCWAMREVVIVIVVVALLGIMAAAVPVHFLP